MARSDILKNLETGTIVRWLVVLTMPFFLALIMVRLLIVWDWPSYPSIEYRRITPDRYGFTPEQRLELAEANLNFLRSPEPAEEAIRLLEELRLPGTSDPLFNQSEISHMFDVKKLVDAFKILMWVLTIVVLGGLIYLLASPRRRHQGYKAMYHGGLFTMGVLLGIGLLTLVSWNFVFTQFHEILFPPGTWQFAYSDSLIRLFPEKFWFDFASIWIGAIFIGGALLAMAGYFLQRR
jgi:integral membrane protein (TIGR01906 family)